MCALSVGGWPPLRGSHRMFGFGDSQRFGGGDATAVISDDVKHLAVAVGSRRADDDVRTINADADAVKGLGKRK